MPSSPTSVRFACLFSKNKRSAQQHARKRGIKGKCPEVSRHPCAGHATEVQPPKQLACPFCAFSTPLPALQKHIASHFDNPGLVSQLQAQLRQKHKGTPVTTLSSFWGSKTGRAAVQSDISNCAAWWKLSPEEEAAAVADPYCHSPLVPSDVSQCAAWWKLSPEEEEAEIADLYCHCTPVQPDVSNCAAWWELGPEEEAAEIADLYGSSPVPCSHPSATIID